MLHDILGSIKANSEARAEAEKAKAEAEAELHKLRKELEELKKK